MQCSRRTIIIGAAGTVAGLAVAQGIRRDMGEPISVLDFIPPNQHATILAHKFGYDATADLVRAINTASLERRKLLIPAGLYCIIPATTFASEAGPCHLALPLRSHLHIEAEKGACFRVANGLSTAADPFFMCMFGTNEVLEDISIVGLEMDMNGANNLISADRVPGRYSRLNQAHIYVSGTPRGVAARIDNARLEGCRFLNTAGVSCLVMAQSNRPGVALGRGWRLINNEFLNNGLDTDDHSSVFAWAEDVFVQGNRFTNDNPPGETGGNTAFEVHGANTKFVGNTIRHYYRGLWVSENLTAVSENILIRGNVLDGIKAFGVATFGQVEALRPACNVKIADNIIFLSNDLHPRVDLKAGVMIASRYGQSKIEVVRNRVLAGGNATGTAAVAVSAPRVAGEIHDVIVISGNTAERTTFGEIIKTNDVCGLGTIIVTNNKRYNLSPAGAFDSPMGLAVGFDTKPSPIDHLVIGGNSCVDDRGAAAEFAYGTYISGEIRWLTYAPETFHGVTTDYAERGLSVTTREKVPSAELPVIP